jgi:2-methylcitrate dehydratase PrpD
LWSRDNLDSGLINDERRIRAMNGGVTERLAEFLLRTQFGDLPDEVVTSTKRVILDTIGASLAGFKTEIGTILTGLVRDLGGKPESTIIGSGEKSSCLNAAMVNAKTANALDCDDTFLNYSHLSPVCVHSALSVAERENLSGRDFLLAVALAYDLTARVGSSIIMPGHARGGSMTWLIVGAISPAVKLLRLDLNRTLNAFGIGCANAPVQSATKSMEYPVSMLKYADMGTFAYTGILAALAAQKGYTGSKNVLEGDGGFWKMCGGEGCDYELMVKDLGKKWYILESSIKPYPCCRWIHIPLDLTAKILREQNLKTEDIEEIRVGVNPFIKEQNVDFMPEDGTSAQFNIGYNLTMLCLGVETSGEWQTSKWMKDKNVEKIFHKIKIDEDPEANRIIAESKPEHLGFRETSASVTIKAKGKLFTEKAGYAKGDPWTEETRLSDEDVLAKFRKYTIRLGSSGKSWSQKIENIKKVVFDLEKTKNVGELTDLLKIE